MKRQPPRAEDFTIGWICALEIEFTAARIILDEEYEDEDHERTQYSLGRIGKHNVVLVVLPGGQIGTNSAAVAAANLRSAFPAIQFGLMVGIGGGTPSPNADIRLGDIVVSQPLGRYGGVVQYDFGKTGFDGQQIRTGSLNAPPTCLLTAVAKTRSDMKMGRNKLLANLSRFAEYPEFDRRKTGPDVLFASSYNHAGGETCNKCLPSRTVTRVERGSEVPDVHYGTIASGNQVIKDGLTRDKLSADLEGVLCFEMEAAGLMNIIPCLIIRGICDYADSHKNKTWQPFAVAVAAAYAKVVLSSVPSSSKSRNHDRTLLRQDSDPVITTYQRERYLRLLKFNQIEARHETIRPALDKTCKWLLDRPEYEAWRDIGKLLEHHGFLWIKGKPATGKSTIMKFALTSAKKMTNDDIIISFFFNARGVELEKSTLGMYRSLLLQLLKKVPEVQKVFDSLPYLTSTDFAFYKWDVDKVKELFRQAIEQLGERSLICFIDALDECDEDQVRDMVAYFEHLGCLAISSSVQFRVCFSSRHHPHISFVHGIQLILEDQDGHRQDIANFLHSELRAGRSNLVDQIKEEIIERASRIFLWVVLIVPMLNKEYDHGRIHALKKRLDEIPDGLDRLFNEILTRDGQYIDELILCLQWVLYAERPLEPKELYYAIIAGSAPESLSPWDPEEITENDMERFIVSSSKGLTEVTRVKPRSIQFIHESVKDFLLTDDGLNRLSSRSDAAYAAQSHDRLKECCQKYITAKISKHLGLPSPLPNASSKAGTDLRERATKLLPSLKYALRNVFFHASVAERLGVSQDLFIREFPLDTWLTLDNLFQSSQRRRHSSNASLSYIFAERDLPHLIRIERRRVSTIDIRGERHELPIFAALKHGSKDAIRALLLPDKGILSKKSLSDDKFIHLGDVFSKMISSLYREAFAINSRRYGNLLSWAAERGYLDIAKALIATLKVDVNAGQKKGWTPLHFAADLGHEEIVQLLLEQPSIKINARDYIHRTALSYAAQQGHKKIVQLLLSQPNIQLNGKSHMGRTALSFAAEYGHKDIVQLLLAQANILVNLRSNGDWTALFYAAACGHEDIVTLLLSQPGIHFNIHDKNGQTPLACAVEYDQKNAVDRLLKEHGININTKNTDGQTPLFQAARKGYIDLVQLLSTQDGVEINAHDNMKLTPLAAAAELGHEKVVEVLASRDGIDIHSQDCKRRTPLNLAMKNGHEGVAKLLQQIDGNSRVCPKTKDVVGKSLLSALAFQERLKLRFQSNRDSRQTF